MMIMMIMIIIMIIMIMIMIIMMMIIIMIINHDDDDDDDDESISLRLICWYSILISPISFNYCKSNKLWFYLFPMYLHIGFKLELFTWPQETNCTIISFRFSYPSYEVVQTDCVIYTGLVFHDGFFMEILPGNGHKCASGWKTVLPVVPIWVFLLFSTLVRDRAVMHLERSRYKRDCIQFGTFIRVIRVMYLCVIKWGCAVV